MATDPLSFLDEVPAQSSKRVSNDPLSFLDETPKRLSKPNQFAARYGLGRAGLALAPYEFGVAPLASKEAMQVPYRENLMADIERLQEQKQAGLWSSQDQQLYDSLVDQLKNPQKAEGFIKPVDISIRGLAEKGAEQLGYDIKPEGFLEHTAGMLSPKEALNIAKSVPKALKSLKGVPQKMISGLSKPAALEAKYPRLGTLSSAKQALKIQKLEKEASDLVKKSVEKHVPYAKETQAGLEFGKVNKQRFEKLKHVAEKANPDIDITPIQESFLRQAEKYRGIPSPGPEASKIAKEIRAFRQKPQTGLGNLLKIFRNNNMKKVDIYENALLKGKQKEYVGFLDDMNRSIVKAVEQSLPEDSKWLKEFKELNKGFKEGENAQKVLGQLKGIISEHPKSTDLEKLVYDVSKQRKLEMNMGKEGASEVMQIAKDLSSAKNAIKSMPTSKLNKFDSIYLLSVLFPGLTKYAGILKGVQLGRMAYGNILSSPQKRRAYSDALKAIVTDDIELYKRAALILKGNEES